MLIKAYGTHSHIQIKGIRIDDLEKLTYFSILGFYDLCIISDIWEKRERIKVMSLRRVLFVLVTCVSAPKHSLCHGALTGF